MLEIKNISKSYKIGTFVQKALKNINLKFRKSEFVAILGPSGSGKTTLLNIIGGLDRYDSGDLIIKGKSTKKFKDKDWDAYRNNSVGFIFQSYNLISHINLLDNVEMGMTLSGKKGKERKNKAIDLLKEVGLDEHIHKRPNQLSGGQMQRVAIARALANDPEIILADEPTGALDSKTSTQIMELIKKISKNKLVIMVTHNNELADKYADRVIKMKDGEITDDSNPLTNNDENEISYKLKRTAMNIFTALHLSLNNIRTKKGRTILTAFASSIGIIGIALILSLSNGFSKQIELFEKNTSDAMPILITSQKNNMSSENFSSAISEETGLGIGKSENSFPDTTNISIKDQTIKSSINPITNEYISYLKDIPEEYISSVSINYGTNLNLIQKNEDKYIALSTLNVTPELMPYANFNNYENSSIFSNYYDILAGRMPTEKDEIIIEINKQNKISKDIYKALGLTNENASFEEVLGAEIKLVENNDYYQKFNNYYLPKDINEEMYNNKNNLILKVVGIIRVKEEKSNIMSSQSGIYYNQELAKYVRDINSESEILKAQKTADYNVMTGEKIDLSTDEGKSLKDNLIAYLGGDETPQVIYIFPTDFNYKDKIVEYLDKYNEGKEEEKQVFYIDQAELITNISDGIMDGITIVLIAFSSISLIVSSIMLGIITYISVLERTKEIGILRSLGARKKDIRRVFNAETGLIGITSGVIGIAIALLMTIPLNNFLYEKTQLENVAVLNPTHAVILIAISVILTLIGGAIPAHIASKKDPVNALRTE